MTKITLTYDFNDEDSGDMHDYKVVTNANKYWSLLHEIFQELRAKQKYCNEETGYGSWAEAYELIWQLAKDEGVQPWEEIF